MRRLPTLLSITLLMGCVTPITDEHRNSTVRYTETTPVTPANDTPAIATPAYSDRTTLKRSAMASATVANDARHTSQDRPTQKTQAPTASDRSFYGALPADITSVEGISELFALARGWVEQETRTNLLHVSLSLTSDRMIQKQVRHETQKLVHGQFDNSTFAERFLNTIVGDQSGGYAALYVSDSQRIMVSEPLLKAFVASVGKDVERRRAAVLSLLIHELVHAADDRLYGIHKNRALSLKSSFTLSATFEGHAQLLTRRICAARGCLSGLGSLENFMFNAGGSGPVAQGVQAVSRNMLEYSYIEGERFLSRLANRPNGEALIRQVMISPPEDPIQILVPETYPNVSREYRNETLKQGLLRARHSWNQQPWKMIETSPIKGINVRHSPERRVAAVEGFTRLIRSMVGAQLYNQDDISINPVDVMLIETDGLDTARLFAESFLNQNNQGTRIRLTDPRVKVSTPHTGYQEFALTEASGRETLVGVHGNRVIHITADSQRTDLATMRRFSQAVFATL